MNLAAGCSVGFVKAPRSASQPAGCSESYAAPIVDAAIAGALVSFAVWDNVREREGPDYVPASTTTPLLVGPALLYMLSAASGVSDVGACRRASARVEVGQRE